jgi:acetyl esterase/lipase
MRHPVFDAPKPRRPRATLPYGTRDSSVYDARPSARAVQCGGVRDVTLALVHGEFWRAHIDRQHLDALAQALADDGYHVANVEYARTGMPGGGWPGTGADLLAALAAIRNNPDLPGEVVLVGHSAGGQLGLWAASKEEVTGLSGVVALGPVCDLAQADTLGLGEGATVAFLGASRESAPARWRDADPSRHRLRTPSVLIVGGRDDRVPPSLAHSYLASRGEGEARAQLVELPGCDHFDLIDPRHPTAYASLLTAIASLT